MSRFETNTEILKNACFEMGTLIKKTFGLNEEISLEYIKPKSKVEK